jgi:Domain of unknown function (DUF4276)
MARYDVASPAANVPQLCLSGRVRTVLVPIVEGQSEERSIGVLLRRMLSEMGVYDAEIARPFRVKRGRVVREGELERSVKQAIRSRVGATGVLVLLDADDDCPAELASMLLPRVSDQAVPVRIVVPKAETESWILAAIESLRGHRGIRHDALPPPDPESVRDAKGALSSRMEGTRGYVATDDQPALLGTMDLALAEERSPSFAKLRRDLVALIGSAPASQGAGSSAARP